MPNSEGGIFAGHGLLESPLTQFLVQAIIVILMTRVLAIGLHYINQPRVIAEVIGGIILGPSVFGKYIPGFSEVVFPKSSYGYLALVANIGLVLYLFLVGVELDPKAMIKNARKTLLVSSAGIIFPWGLGFAVAPFLYTHTIAGEPGFGNTPIRSFTVFVCVAISITAFPVLARILNETNMLSTLVGNTALGAAALDDVVAWSLLALSIALIHSTNPATTAWIFLSVAAYAAGLIGIVRPLWGKLVKVVERSGSHAVQTFLMALTFLFVFFSAWVTEILGVHAIFGAFLTGLCMPRNHPFTIKVSERIEDLVQIVFLPLYFTLSGLKTNIGTIQTGEDLLILLIVMVTAIAAKFIGCTIGAKLTGLNWRESSAVGVLMNTRGLVELIVLNIGLEAKVITPKLFTILVMMAILTTVMTSPLIALIYPASLRTYVKEEETSPTSRKRKTPDDVCALFVVHHLEEIPAITTLMHLLKPQKRSAALRVVGSHLIESSIATTDILKAHQRRAAQDPSLQMLSVLGTMLGASVETDVMVGNPRSFADTLVRKSKDETADLIVVPHKQGMYFLAESYDHFLEEMVSRAPSDVVFLVNPTGSPHDLLAGRGKTRDVLVIVSGEQHDLEVLTLARRFRSSADVNVTLLILKDHPVYDERITPALAAFTSSVDNTRGLGSGSGFSSNSGATAAGLTVFTLSGSDVNSSTLEHQVAAKAWDFIVMGQSSLEIEAASEEFGEETKRSLPATLRGRPAQFELKSPVNSARAAAEASTPRHNQHGSKGKRHGVLGTLAGALIEANVSVSMLVVHAGKSFAESSLSTKLAASDSARVTLKEAVGEHWDIERGVSRDLEMSIRT